MKFNYVAIPRTGSRSIRQALSVWNNGFNHDPIWKHPKADFNMTFMREPLERSISWFYFHKQLKSAKDSYQFDIEEWAEKGFSNHWTKADCENYKVRHGLSQIDYMTINGKNVMDFIGDFANLNSQLIDICKDKEIKLRPIHHVGKRTGPYPQKVSNSYKTKLHDLLKEDFDLYEDIRK